MWDLVLKKERNRHLTSVCLGVMPAFLSVLSIKERERREGGNKREKKNERIRGREDASEETRDRKRE
jgi:hypothetical protein